PVQLAVAAPIVAEVAEPRLRGWHRVHRRHATPLPDSGIVGKEERPVVPVIHAGDHQRPAEGAAELLRIERRHRVLLQRPVGPLYFPDEEVARVERVVAQILVAGSVELVAARFRRDGYHARATAELG